MHKPLMRIGFSKCEPAQSSCSHKSLRRIFIGFMLLIVWVLISDTNAREIGRSEFEQLASKCAPDIAPDTMASVIEIESGFRPYAIAVVNGPSFYPETYEEALLKINEIATQNVSFSVGLGQINNRNFERMGVTPEQMLDPCFNIKASAQVLGECYRRAIKEHDSQSDSLKAALSCYYSGNFITGIKQGYVDKVVRKGKERVPSIKIIQDFNDKPQRPLLEQASQPSGLIL